MKKTVVLSLLLPLFAGCVLKLPSETCENATHDIGVYASVLEFDHGVTEPSEFDGVYLALLDVGGTVGRSRGVYGYGIGGMHAEVQGVSVGLCGGPGLTNGIHLTGLGFMNCTCGAQLDLFGWTGYLMGVHLSGIGSLIEGGGVGLQMSTLFNGQGPISREACIVGGQMAAVYNSVWGLKGGQIGMFNRVERHFSGIQLGFFNFNAAEDFSGAQIGLLNFREGSIPLPLVRLSFGGPEQ